MPNFSNDPPDQAAAQTYRLVRTPPTAKFTAHVISDRLIGCYTHFVNNRTVPCESPTCSACDSSITRRWHGYLLVQLDTTQETVIFEMTLKATTAFSSYHELHGTTRGCHFQAARLHGKPNGRVLIQTKTGDLSRVHLPPQIPIEKLLCHIWNMPPNQTSKRGPTPAQPHTEIKIHRENPEIPAHPAPPSRIEKALDTIAQNHGRNGD